MHRINLTLQRLNQGAVVPFNYQYDLSRAFLKLLSAQSRYDDLFCLGRLELYPFKLMASEGGFALSDAKLQAGMLTPWKYQTIYEALIDRELSISDTRGNSARWIISDVKKQDLSSLTGEMSEGQRGLDPRGNTISPPLGGEQEGVIIKSSSPVLIRQRYPSPGRDGREANETYLTPNDPLFVDLLIDSIYRNWLDYSGHQIDTRQCHIQIIKHRTRLITLKSGTPEEIRVRANELVMKVKLPAELLQTAFCGGVGHMTSMGLGCLSL